MLARGEASGDCDTDDPYAGEIETFWLARVPTVTAVLAASNITDCDVRPRGSEVKERVW